MMPTSISNKTFKALSALLAYPTRELTMAIPEIAAVIDGTTNPRGLRAIVANRTAETARYPDAGTHA